MHLEVLADSVARGAVVADDLLGRFHGDWDGDLSRIYAAMSY